MHLAANSNLFITFSLMSKYILTRLYPANNILALPQIHKSQLCHRFIKVLSPKLLLKHTLHKNFFNTQSVTSKYLSSCRILPFNLKGKKKFSHKLCPEPNSAFSVCPRWSQFSMKSTLKPTNCTSWRNHLVVTFTIEISVWIILYTKYMGLKF